MVDDRFRMRKILLAEYLLNVAFVRGAAKFVFFFQSFVAAVAELISLSLRKHEIRFFKTTSALENNKNKKLHDYSSF